MRRRGAPCWPGLAGAAALAPGAALAQQNAKLGMPASVITNPPRQWDRGHPAIYPDPDVLVLDPSFTQYTLGNAEVCANLAFGGPKRDRLFMAAEQSLYVLQVQTQGAAPG